MKQHKQVKWGKQFQVVSIHHRLKISLSSLFQPFICGLIFEYLHLWIKCLPKKKSNYLQENQILISPLILQLW